MYHLRLEGEDAQVSDLAAPDCKAFFTLRIEYAKSNILKLLIFSGYPAFVVMLTLMDSNLNLIFTQVKNYFDENYGTVPQQHGVIGPHL